MDDDELHIEGSPGAGSGSSWVPEEWNRWQRTVQDPPTVVEARTLSKRSLDRLDHIHDTTGVCLKNRFGPKCAPVGQPPARPASTSPHWSIGTYDHSGLIPSPTQSEMRKFLDRMKPYVEPPLHDPEALSKWLDEE